MSDTEAPQPGDPTPQETAPKAARQEEKLVLPPALHKPERAWRSVMKGLGFTLALGGAAAGSFLLFRMLNKTTVHGLENIPSEHENVLYCLNHNSILDNFAFEVAAYLPKIMLSSKYLPISLADRKNFFGDPKSRKFKDQVLRLLGRYFFEHLKAYPVDRQAKDLDQVDRWIEMLKENIVIVFPEGTRTRTGEIGPGKPGVGKLIYDARPTVIPVHMTGTGEVLGVGRRIPNVFKSIEINIGTPMDLSDLLAQPLPEERKEQLSRYAEISDRVIEAIRLLDPEAVKAAPAEASPPPPPSAPPPHSEER